MRLISNRLYLSEGEGVDMPVLRALEKEADRIKAQIEVLDIDGRRVTIVNPTLPADQWDDRFAPKSQLVNGPVPDMTDSNAEKAFWTR